MSRMFNYIQCFYRRIKIFHYCSSRTYLILFLVMFCIFPYYYIYSSLLISSQHSTNQIPRIMYVVRTVNKYYSNRLIYLLQTWISLVYNDVYFISDTIIPNISVTHIISTESICGPSSHSVRSLCCQTIHDFIFYRRYILNYDWFCHFDDDQYVHIKNLQEYLSKLDFNLPYYIGRNSWITPFKRKKKSYTGDFWFATLGAGVCYSKKLIYLLEPYTQTPIQFINGCLHEYYPDDIYIGFLIHNRLNLSLTKNERFHSHLEHHFYDEKNTFHQQITFGFGLPRNIPKLLPPLFPLDTDRLRIRTLHCFLYPHFKDCQIRLQTYGFNRTT